MASIYLERRIPLLIIISILIIMFLGIYSFVNLQRIIHTSRLLSQSSRIINHAEQVIKTIVDIETGYRGYVITGDSAFLKPLVDAYQNIDFRIEVLDSLCNGFPFQKNHINALAELSNESRIWSRAVIESRNENFEQAQQLVLSGKGLKITDSIRQNVVDIQEQQRTIFREKNTITSASLKKFQVSSLVLIIVTITLISYLFYVVVYALKSRSAGQRLLQQSLDEVNDLYDNAPCGYLSADSTITIININQTLLNWLGYTREEVVGKMHYADLLSPATRQGFLDSFEKVFENFISQGYLNNLSFEFVRKDGTVFPVIVNSEAVFNDAGVFVRTRTTIFDDTERQHSEKKFSDILESTPDALVIVNNLGIIQIVNRQTEKIFGYSRDELYGKPVEALMPNRFAELHKSHLKAFFNNPHARPMGTGLDLFGFSKSSKEFPVEISLSPINLGKEILVAASIRDVTERKRLEKLIAERAAIVDSSEDAIISLTGNGKIYSWNKGAEILYGYTFDEVRGKDIDMLVPHDLMIQERQILEKVNQGISIKHYETVRLSKDGRIFDISLSISPIKDNIGKIIGVSKIARDISEIKKRNLEILELNAQLDAFTYSVSHDLRAPLRSITGYSQILLEDYGDKLDNEGIRVANIIVKSTNRMGILIDDLLNFCRLGRTEIQTSVIDMKLTVEKVLSDNNLLDMESIMLGDLLPAPADEKMIMHVWNNLISNAIKYSSKKNAPAIEIGSYQNNQEVCYFVRDNGVGFDMRYYDKLFGVFQRLHRADDFEGTGVGLALVKKIVQKHGGNVWAEAEPDKGAVFYFSLPMQNS